MEEIIAPPDQGGSRAFAKEFLEGRFEDVRDEPDGGWSALCPLCDGDTRIQISREVVVETCPNGHTAGETFEATAPPEPEVPSLSVGLAEFFDSCDASIEWLLEPYVCKGGFTLVQGAPKSGKTWFVAWLAAAVAARGKRVVFVEEEGAKEVLRDRLKPFADRDTKTLRIMFRKRIRLDSQKSLESLIEEVRAQQADLVVLDPFIAFHGKREKESDEMAMVLGAIRDLITATGCAVVLVHHTRKGDSWDKSSNAEASSVDARGSGALVGDVDHVIAIKGLPFSKKKDGEIRFFVENPDTRIGAGFAKKLLCFTLSSGLMAELDVSAVSNPELQASQLLARMLPLLPEPPASLSRNKLREALRVRKDTLLEAVDLGVQRGCIIDNIIGISRLVPGTGAGTSGTREPGNVVVVPVVVPIGNHGTHRNHPKDDDGNQ